jgi:hypothetical protein
MIAAGKFADMAIGTVAIEGLPDALRVEHAVVAKVIAATKIALRNIREENRF